MTAVLVTRPTIEATPLVHALRAAALHVHAVPAVGLVPVSAGSDAGRRVRRAFAALRSTDWIVVTSRFGAGVAARQLRLVDGLSYASVRWATVGSAAAGVLRASGIEPAVRVSTSDPHALVSALAADGLAGRRVLLARSDVADPWLPGLIAATGALVHDVATYRTIEGPSSGRSALRAATSDPDLRAIVVASGSAARGLVAMLQGEPGSRAGLAGHLERIRALPTITIGPATTAVACSVGLRVAAEADQPTVAGIVRAVSASLATAHPGPLAQPGGIVR